jgi:reactive intermediate/imine deaminase
MSKTKFAAFIITLLGVGFFAGVSAQTGKRFVNPRSAVDATVPPFSGAVIAGNTMYLSGALGMDPGNKPPATVEAEATNVLNNIQNTLKQGGMTMDDLVYVQIFCPDVANYDAFNKVYRTYFKNEFPARAFLGSGPLLFGARFEVQGIAVTAK